LWPTAEERLDLARGIDDVRAPPANRLEQLTRDRANQSGLRVNDQFRICFRWTGIALRCSLDRTTSCR
jgi:proteic killer suppression protein